MENCIRAHNLHCRCVVYSPLASIFRQSSDLNVLSCFFRKNPDAQTQWPAGQSPSSVPRASGSRRDARRACEPRGRRRRVRIAAVSRAKFVAFSRAVSSRPDRFPLTRAAAARYRERRGRAIGRARPFPGATESRDRKPRVVRSRRRPPFPSRPRRVAFVSRALARVSALSPFRIHRVGSQSDGDRSIGSSIETVTFSLSSSRWNSDRRGNDRHCATCASRREQRIVH